MQQIYKYFTKKNKVETIIDIDNNIIGQGSKNPTTNSVGGLRPPEEFGN